VGIAVYFFVKNRGLSGCRNWYDAARDYGKADEKRDFISIKRAEHHDFEELAPTGDDYWIGLQDNRFGKFVALANEATSVTRVTAQERAIFKIISLGISTNRDEWLYDISRQSLTDKVTHLIDSYDSVPQFTVEFPTEVKWSESLKRRKRVGRVEPFDRERIRRAAYRPFSRRWLYQSPLFIDRPGRADVLFPVGAENRGICFSGVGSRTTYCVLAIDGLADLHFGAGVDGFHQVTLYRFVEGQRLDNITDWALEQFREKYESSLTKGTRPITKEAIFHYIYGVLYDPIYREKYALNLQRELPRIPFYTDFWRWGDWGEMLMDLHVGYKTVERWSLRRLDTPDERSRRAGLAPKIILKPNRGIGVIQLDSETQLAGVPREAWDYRLGNRSALEWILDQHKEKRPKDPTIRETFNTYRFADHKEKVIDLLMRVTRVSVETVKIVEAMRELPRTQT
jgi:predicted helicase